MLAARTTPSLARGSAPAVQRCVRVNAFKPVNTQGLVAAVAAGSLLLAGPSFAVLPEGYSSPQGSNTADLEAKLDALIEQRTGKAEALPELTQVPEIKAEAPQKKEAPVVVAAPMAPAVAEPPTPRPAPAVVEAPTPAPAPAAAVVEERPKGLQTRPESPSAAAAAPAAPQGGLLIGGAVATLGVVAAAALANNGSGSEGQAAAAAAAAPAGDAAAAAPPAPEAETASAAVGGAGESANPSAKAE